MNVALDSNVFIKDAWLGSQGMRTLLDYLAKTPYRMILSEVVEAEVRAHWRRKFEEKSEGVAASLRDARRARVRGLPGFDPGAAVDETMAAWEACWAEFLDAASVRRVGIGAEQAAEAARRAAFREAPCGVAGKGVRDGLIWLALAADAADAEQGSGDHGLAFISPNTKDFAAPDGRSLREELLADVVGRGSRLAYYSSLEDFLRERAKPIGHVDRAWVLSRLDLGRLEAPVRERVRSDEALHHAFRVDDPARRRLYDVVGDPEPVGVDLRLEDFYVWQFDDGHAELRMTLAARLVAKVECVNLPDFQISEFSGLTYWNEEEDEDNPLTLVLGCSASLAARASARVEGDGLSEPVLEDLGWP